MFGLSSALTKPTLDFLHESVGTMLSHWECYALAIAGVGRLRLAAGVARDRAPRAVGRDRFGREPRRRDPDRNLLLDERLSRPTWHVVLAVIGLGLALVGAVVISLAHEAAKEEPSPATDVGEGSVAPA